MRLNLFLAAVLHRSSVALLSILSVLAPASAYAKEPQSGHKPLPSTGDAATDAKLAELFQQREQKMQPLPLPLETSPEYGLRRTAFERIMDSTSADDVAYQLAVKAVVGSLKSRPRSTVEIERDLNQSYTFLKEQNDKALNGVKLVGPKETRDALYNILKSVPAVSIPATILHEMRKLDEVFDENTVEKSAREMSRINGQRGWRNIRSDFENSPASEMSWGDVMDYAASDPAFRAAFDQLNDVKYGIRTSQSLNDYRRQAPDQMEGLENSIRLLETSDKLDKLLELQNGNAEVLERYAANNGIVEEEVRKHLEQEIAVLKQDLAAAMRDEFATGVNGLRNDLLQNRKELGAAANRLDTIAERIEERKAWRKDAEERATRAAERELTRQACEIGLRTALDVARRFASDDRDLAQRINQVETVANAYTRLSDTLAFVACHGDDIDTRIAMIATGNFIGVTLSVVDVFRTAREGDSVEEVMLKQLRQLREDILDMKEEMREHFKGVQYAIEGTNARLDAHFNETCQNFAAVFGLLEQQKENFEEIDQKLSLLYASINSMRNEVMGGMKDIEDLIRLGFEELEALEFWKIRQKVVDLPANEWRQSEFLEAYAVCKSKCLKNRKGIAFLSPDRVSLEGAAKDLPGTSPARTLLYVARASEIYYGIHGMASYDSMIGNEERWLAWSNLLMDLCELRPDYIPRAVALDFEETAMVGQAIQHTRNKGLYRAEGEEWLRDEQRLKNSFVLYEACVSAVGEALDLAHANAVDSHTVVRGKTVGFPKKMRHVEGNEMLDVPAAALRKHLDDEVELYGRLRELEHGGEVQLVGSCSFDYARNPRARFDEYIRVAEKTGEERWPPAGPWHDGCRDRVELKHGGGVQLVGNCSFDYARNPRARFDEYIRVAEKTGGNRHYLIGAIEGSIRGRGNYGYKYEVANVKRKIIEESPRIEIWFEIRGEEGRGRVASWQFVPDFFVDVEKEMSVERLTDRWVRPSSPGTLFDDIDSFVNRGYISDREKEVEEWNSYSPEELHIFYDYIVEHIIRNAGEWRGTGHAMPVRQQLRKQVEEFNARRCAEIDGEVKEMIRSALQDEVVVRKYIREADAEMVRKALAELEGARQLLIHFIEHCLPEYERSITPDQVENSLASAFVWRDTMTADNCSSFVRDESSSALTRSRSLYAKLEQEILPQLEASLTDFGRFPKVDATLKRLRVMQLRLSGAVLHDGSEL